MTPGELSRAVTAARKREYRQGLPTAYLAASVGAVFSGKGGPKPPSIEDFLGPNPYASAPPGRTLSDASLSSAATRGADPTAERVARARARIAAMSERMERERLAQQPEPADAERAAPAPPD